MASVPKKSNGGRIRLLFDLSCLARWLVDVEGMEDTKIFNGSVVFTAANRCIFEVVNRDCLCDVVNINIEDVRPPS